jgi:hypothetical protein
MENEAGEGVAGVYHLLESDSNRNLNATVAGTL